MCENIHDPLVLQSVPSMFSGEDWTQVESDLEQMNETNETKPKWKTISLVAEKEEQNEVFIPHHRHTVCNYQQWARSYDSLKHTAKSKLFYYLGIFPQNICFIFIMKTSYFIRCLTSHEHFRKWRREMHTHICAYMHSYIHIYEVKITFTRTLWFLPCCQQVPSTFQPSQEPSVKAVLCGFLPTVQTLNFSLLKLA